MNTATLPPPGPGPGQPIAAEALIPGHDLRPVCSSMPPGWTGLAGRVGEAIEQALAAAPGDATGSSMTPRLVGTLAGPDRALTVAPAWWLEWHAQVEHAELDHRADAALAAAALTCTHAQAFGETGGSGTLHGVLDIRDALVGEAQ